MNNESGTIINFIDKIMVILSAILPLTGYYKAPFLFSELTTLLSMILALWLIVRLVMKKGGKLAFGSSEKATVAFGVWMIIITFLSGFFGYSNSSNINTFIAVLTILIMLLLYSNFKELQDYFVKAYTAIALFCIAIYIVQFVAYVFLHRAISFTLPLPLSEAYKASFDYSGRLYSNVQLSSVFSEKAHFCQYILPLEIFLVYRTRNKGNIWAPILITLIIFSTASGVGIVCSIIIWLLFFIHTEKNDIRSLIRNLGILIVVSATVIIVHNVLLKQSPQYANTIGRLFVSSIGISTKADYRIYRGFFSYTGLPFLAKIFGIGYRQYSGFANMYGLQTAYDQAGTLTEYFSAIFQVGIYFGIIGIALAGVVYGRLFKQVNHVGQIVLIVFGALSISSSVFLEATCFVYFVIVLAMRNKSVGESSV